LKHGAKRHSGLAPAFVGWHRQVFALAAAKMKAVSLAMLAGMARAQRKNCAGRIPRNSSQKKFCRGGLQSGAVHTKSTIFSEMRPGRRAGPATRLRPRFLCAHGIGKMSAKKKFFPDFKSPLRRPDGELDIDAVIAWACDVAETQIGTIRAIGAREERTDAMNRDEANARARDARTLNELVRTLERLEALEAARKMHGRRTRWKQDGELKAALVRRMDKLLECTRAAANSRVARGRRGGAA
jgi:hypothetical protein